MGLFGKKETKEQKGCCCGSCGEVNKSVPPASEGASIKVLGSGCRNCVAACPMKVLRISEKTASTLSPNWRQGAGRTH